MLLSKTHLSQIKSQPGLCIPTAATLNLPEKVLQFGTGVLLRGLPDYYIDKANRQGLFNGRIVVVKSTSNGGTDAFGLQDGLFTHCVQGIESNQRISETIINSAISRVLSASDQWQEILRCAANPEMKLIISNTTEVGIVTSDDKVDDTPPSSFPGKLLAFLYERFRVFNGTDESGMVIVPTELITDNGGKLKTIVLELAAKNNLPEAFINWLHGSNHFCNSLVDRIVPGKLPATEQRNTEAKLGYQDDLMIMSESFSLWAIETSSERVKEVLSFAKVDQGIVIAPDIEKFRELKLRLLNGTHTFSCGLAFLAGFETVKEAMNNEYMSAYVRRLMMLEVATVLDSEMITYNEACAYANTVMDRFRNPFIDHKWISITMNFTSKMRMRNIPLLIRHYQKTSRTPEHMALGFAAYLLFMRCKKNNDGTYTGEYNGRTYPVQDDKAAFFTENWNAANPAELVKTTLANQELWGADLHELPGFADAVIANLQLILQEGAPAAIERGALNKTTA